MVVGAIEVRRAYGHEERYRFSCSVNFETGRVRSAQIESMQGERDREILDTEFQLINKPVRTKRQKLGKVSDFSYNDGLFVQKLYVARSLVKVFAATDTLIIDRSQILEITDQHILVRDTEVPVAEEELAGAAAPA